MQGAGEPQRHVLTSSSGGHMLRCAWLHACLTSALVGDACDSAFGCCNRAMTHRLHRFRVHTQHMCRCAGGGGGGDGGGGGGGGGEYGVHFRAAGFAQLCLACQGRATPGNLRCSACCRYMCTHCGHRDMLRAATAAVVPGSLQQLVRDVAAEGREGMHQRPTRACVHVLLPLTFCAGAVSAV